MNVEEKFNREVCKKCILPNCKNIEGQQNCYEEYLKSCLKATEDQLKIATKQVEKLIRKIK